MMNSLILRFLKKQAAPFLLRLLIEFLNDLLEKIELAEQLKSKRNIVKTDQKNYI